MWVDHDNNDCVIVDDRSELGVECVGHEDVAGVFGFAESHSTGTRVGVLAILAIFGAAKEMLLAARQGVDERWQAAVAVRRRCGSGSGLDGRQRSTKDLVGKTQSAAGRGAASDGGRHHRHGWIGEQRASEVIT